MSAITKIVIFLTAISYGGYSSAREIDPPYGIISLKLGEEVYLDGLVEYKGEVVFYSSVDAKRLKLVFPYCISGVSDLPLEDITGLSGKMVRVNAIVASVEEPEREENVISTTVSVEGRQIKNWCFGDRALKILKIEKLK